MKLEDLKRSLGVDSDDELADRVAGLMVRPVMVTVVYHPASGVSVMTDNTPQVAIAVLSSAIQQLAARSAVGESQREEK